MGGMIFTAREVMPDAIGGISHFLSGRYVEFRIWGLNYSEFMQFHQLEDSDETFSQYYKFRGLLIW